MRLSGIAILPLVVLGGCALTKRDAPVVADRVNPSIEQRIEARVYEGRAEGTPDIRDVPAPPENLPDAAARAAERAVLTDAAGELAGDVRAAKAEAGSRETLEQRAARLEAEIAAARASAAAEGSLADRLEQVRPD
jgi:hypothetical protein